MSCNNQSLDYIENDGDDDAANQHVLHETVARMTESAAVNRGREQDGRGTGCGEDAAVFGWQPAYIKWIGQSVKLRRRSLKTSKMEWLQQRRHLTKFTRCTVASGIHLQEDNFSVNYRWLQTKLAKSKDRGDSDRLATVSDKAINGTSMTITTGGLLRWDGHTAQTLLHKDLTDNNDVTEQEKYELCIAGKAELTTQMRQDLYHSRVEYMEFPFHQFSSFVSA